MNLSFRYPGSSLKLRDELLKACGRLQGKQVIILRDQPALCARVLTSSDTKGSFVEELVACPAWAPILSVESVDGPQWKHLQSTFRKVFAETRWPERIDGLMQSQIERCRLRLEDDPSFVVDAEQTARIVANIFFELVFERPMTAREESLFYRASLEWRKEIAVKGAAAPDVKSTFWSELRGLVEGSRFAAILQAHPEPDIVLSAIAQPFLISPQINFSDVFSSLFRRLEADAELHRKAVAAAKGADYEYLEGLSQEAIRLEHPFPILEREITRDFVDGDRKFEKGQQVFILMDELEQDASFEPDRWRKGPRHAYQSLTFGAGPRVCLGKNLALKMLGQLLQGLLLTVPSERLRPQQGHLFSGRNNDGKDDLAAMVHQLKTFAGVLKTSRDRGRANRAAGCPMHNVEGRA